MKKIEFTIKKEYSSPELLYFTDLSTETLCSSTGVTTTENESYQDGEEYLVF